MKRTYMIIAAFLVMSFSIAHAQEEVPTKMTIHAGFGTVTMGDVQWQRFSFRPDIPIGNFGIGLDVELFIDEKGKISKEGWDFSNSNKTWDTLLRKIYYVRYGKSLDRFYARAGALDDVSLGYGLIMDGYRNTLNYPGDKKIGLDFALRNVGTFGIGVHGMINSFGDLKNKGIVIGGRVTARPLKPTNKGLISRLTIGATLVRDINQFAGLKDSDNDGYPDFQDGFPDDKHLWLDTDGDGITDYKVSGADTTFIDPDADGDNLTDKWYTEDRGVAILDSDGVEHDKLLNIENDLDGVSVYGFDAGLPLFEGAFNLDIYGQYAGIHTGNEGLDGGWGIAIPGLQFLVERFKARVEYRHFEGRFRGNYFDNLYEHERVTLIGDNIITKEMKLVDQMLNGMYAMMGYNFYEMFSAHGTFQVMNGDKEYQDVTGKIVIQERLLENIPKISIAEAYYYNTYVDMDRYNLFEFTENTLYGTRIGFEIAPSLIVVWDTHYTFTPNGKGGLDKQRFVGIETVVKMR
ncbi:MAG: hypothetical protein JXB48_17815 [Candidatus Latescibacteria bacterium]|nr:hypothetical protein [Candidatus Latescibacterota bacterium]